MEEAGSGWTDLFQTTLFFNSCHVCDVFLPAALRDPTATSKSHLLELKKKKKVITFLGVTKALQVLFEQQLSLDRRESL